MIDPYPARKLLRLLGAVVLFGSGPGRGAIGRAPANAGSARFIGTRQAALIFSKICASLGVPAHRLGRLPMIGDPFLNYFALFLLIFVVVVLFYGIIAIHDIPYMISKSREHPHQDAIHAAGWVSLFTLHALWPFLWIWAMAYRPERGWGFSHQPTSGAGPPPATNELDDLRRRIGELEGKMGTGGR
jgi:hypothetical protein